MWSADMTDAQLRRFIVENGLWEEAQRQDFARKYLPGHEFLLRYTSDFTYNVTVSDGNFQTSGHDFSLGYEFHLVKTTDVLRHWTVEWDIYTGSDYYNVGGMNVRSDEFTHRGMINWYFKHPPSSIHKWMVHLGTGIRIGNAKFVAPGLAKKYVYQVQSFPIWQLGVKYRFRAGDENDYLSRIGFGINSLIIYEQKALTVNDNLFDDIRGNLNVEDVKFSIGISLFF